VRRASGARRVLAVGTGACATVVVIAWTTAGTGGCYTHQCDQSNVILGLGPDGGVVGTGELFATEGTSVVFWESNPTLPAPGQTWTPFNGNEHLTFLLPPDAGIPANATILNYWSYDSAQDAAQVNNVNNSGNLAEYSDAGTGSITVYNATCQSYYIRVVVQFFVPEGVGGDGGLEMADTAKNADGGGD